MKDHTVAIGQLLVTHEQDIQTLRLEIEALKSEVKRLRADLLATLKYAHPAPGAAPAHPTASSLRIRAVIPQDLNDFRFPKDVRLRNKNGRHFSLSHNPSPTRKLAKTFSTSVRRD